jgi:cytochrome c peroxidase
MKRQIFLILSLLAPLIFFSHGLWADDWGDDSSSGAPAYPYPVPLGLKKPKVPQNNPITKEKVDLGRYLYFDKRLSRNNTISCATCHDPAKGWTDQSPVSTGINGLKGTRSAPPVFNATYNELQFWDGRALSLEEQAKGPIQNPVEMGFSLKGVEQKIGRIKGYQKMFKKAFGPGPITAERIVEAIASFERTILSGDSNYDRFIAGNKKALSLSAQRGMNLFFGRAHCDDCHTGPNFSDSRFHNLGVGMNAKHPDLGRYLITKKDKDKGSFKTPGLRGLLYTHPYMHDGSEKTLEAVVDFYNKGGNLNPYLDKKIHPLGLNSQQKKDLVAFLKSLNGKPVRVNIPNKFPR